MLTVSVGASEFDVGATPVRRMILELEDRYPGFGDYVERRMAIAIDGQIHQDAWGAELKPESEVYLIPKIGGGEGPHPLETRRSGQGRPGSRRPAFA